MLFKRYRDRFNADFTAIILMALPLMILVEITADVISSMMGVVPPIECLSKWTYITIVYGGVIVLLYFGVMRRCRGIVRQADVESSAATSHTIDRIIVALYFEFFY